MKVSEVCPMRCDDMAPKRKLSTSRAKPYFDTVRLCFAPTFTKEELMRICKCGGIVRQHQLVNSREAWTCSSCGRYEVVEVKLNKEVKQLGLLQFETGKVSDIKGE